jgi:putative AlgH/UPF0301 family transcriptional regulator
MKDKDVRQKGRKKSKVEKQRMKKGYEEWKKGQI